MLDDDGINKLEGIAHNHRPRFNAYLIDQDKAGFYENHLNTIDGFLTITSIIDRPVDTDNMIKLLKQGYDVFCKYTNDSY